MGTTITIDVETARADEEILHIIASQVAHFAPQGVPGPEAVEVQLRQLLEDQPEWAREVERSRHLKRRARREIARGLAAKFVAARAGEVAAPPTDTGYRMVFSCGVSLPRGAGPNPGGRTPSQ